MNRLFSFIWLLTCCLYISADVSAQSKTEKDLVNEIIINLQTGDDSSYAAMFPTMKLMSELLYAFQPSDEYQAKRITGLRSNQRVLMQFDPDHNPKILGMFNWVRNKGADSGIHWGDILIARYELQKQRLPRELIGFELIAPIRMNGYIFFQDMLTRKKYGVAIRDIFLMNDKWYGGLVMNVLEANTIPDYEYQLKLEEKEMMKLMEAKRNGTLDSILAARDSVKQSKIKVWMQDDEEEDSKESIYKEVVDRKLFRGYFDKEIEVELYVRYLKGPCPETVCDWEAMYRLGDTDNFILLDVERKEDGTWVFTEEEVGVMELKQSGSTFTGTWTSYSDKTEYEVYMKEKEEIKGRKLFKMDKIFEEVAFYGEQ